MPAISNLKFEISNLQAGGAEEIRTPDILLAKQTLCQLSYSPICRGKQESRFRHCERTDSLKTELCDKRQSLSTLAG
jgi:hypothetical protein